MQLLLCQGLWNGVVCLPIMRLEASSGHLPQTDIFLSPMKGTNSLTTAASTTSMSADNLEQLTSPTEAVWRLRLVLSAQATSALDADDSDAPTSTPPGLNPKMHIGDDIRTSQGKKPRGYVQRPQWCLKYRKQLRLYSASYYPLNEIKHVSDSSLTARSRV